MNARTFARTIVAHIIAPTADKVLHAAHQHGLWDSGGELSEWVGGYLSADQYAQFRTDNDLYGLHTFMMIPIGKTTFTRITARTRKQAWSKFCTQHFGALKPRPGDYSIVRVKE